jgi:uncharacterized protein
VVKVKVLDVDVDRQRIGLSLRLGGKPARGPAAKPAAGRDTAKQNRGERRRPGNGAGRRDAAPAGGSMAQALRDAGFGK